MKKLTKTVIHQIKKGVLNLKKSTLFLVLTKGLSIFCFVF